jgi:AcrR family transcriptional regulator
VARRRRAVPQAREARPVPGPARVPLPSHGRPQPAAPPTDIADQTSRYEQRRAAILDAAARLFNEKGVRGATLATVAESVGLRTPAISYYYPSKEHLAAACFLKAIAVFDDIFSHAAQAETSATRLALAVTMYFDWLAEVALNRQPPVVAFNDIRALSPPHTEGVFDAYASMFRQVRRLFSGADGPVFERVEQNARAHLLLALLLWVPGWIHRYEPEDYGRVAARVIDILRHGLLRDAAIWEAGLRHDITIAIAAGEERRNAFLHAATFLMNERGYRGASIDQISARLKLTKGAFYHHNTDKQDLIVACFERTFDVIRRAQNAAAVIGGDGGAILCRAVGTLVRFQMSDQGPLLRTSALHSVGQAVRINMVIRMNRLSNRFSAFIVDGIADGSVRPVDPLVAGELVGGMINAVAELPLWAPRAAPDAAPELFARPLLTGILSRDR